MSGSKMGGMLGAFAPNRKENHLPSPHGRRVRAARTGGKGGPRRAVERGIIERVSLTNEDKQWIDQRREEDRRWVTELLDERLERVETSLLTAFHKWESPMEAAAHSRRHSTRSGSGDGNPG